MQAKDGLAGGTRSGIGSVKRQTARFREGRGGTQREVSTRSHCGNGAAAVARRWIDHRALRAELSVWVGRVKWSSRASRSNRPRSVWGRPAQSARRGVRKPQGRLCVTHASNALRSNTAPNDREWRYGQKITSLQADAGIDAQYGCEGNHHGDPASAGQWGRIANSESPQRRLLGDLRTPSREIASRTVCPVASVLFYTDHEDRG